MSCGLFTAAADVTIVDAIVLISVGLKTSSRVCCSGGEYKHTFCGSFMQCKKKVPTTILVKRHDLQSGGMNLVL